MPPHEGIFMPAWARNQVSPRMGRKEPDMADETKETLEQEPHGSNSAADELAEWKASSRFWSSYKLTGGQDHIDGNVVIDDVISLTSM